MRLLPLVVLMLCAVWVAGPAVGGQGRSRSDEKNKVEFDRDRRGDKTEQSEALTALEAIRKALPFMIQWPKDSGERAIRALLVRGPELVEPLRTMLDTGAVLEKAVAARALCLLGDEESFDAVVALLEDRRQARFAGALLDSLGDLDPARSRQEALRRLEHDTTVMRRGAAHHLRQLRLRGAEDASLIEDVRRVFGATQVPVARVEAFRLLEGWKDPQLTGLAQELVGDSLPTLAAAAADYLAPRCVGPVEDQLREQAQQGGLERKGLHATLILSVAERRTRRPILERTLFDSMISHVRSSDPLLRSVAIMVCATIGLREEDLADAMDNTVVPALAEIVVRGRYFADFDLCFHHSVALLERVTGQNHGDSVPAWREYWAAHGGQAFLSVRELEDIRVDADPPSARLVLEQVDERGQWRVMLRLLGENYRLRLQDEELGDGMILSVSDMRQLLVELRGQGFLDPTLPRELVHHTPGSARLTLDVRGRARTVVGDSGDALMHGLASLAYARSQPSYWQRMLLRDESFADRFREEEAWWRQNQASEARTGRLVDLAVLSLGKGGVAKDMEILDLLLHASQVGAVLNQRRANDLAAFVRTSRGLKSVREQAFALLMKSSPTVAWSAVVETWQEPTGSLEWVVAAIHQLGNRTEALASPLVAVRLAGLESAGEADDSLRDQVTSLVESDPDARVRARALHWMAKHGGELGQELLTRRAREGGPAERSAAMEALGTAGDEVALGILEEGLRDEDLGVAQAAMEGLRLRGTDGAALVLETAVRELGLADTRGYLALTQLKAMPRPVAIPALRRLRETEGDLAREALHGLADRGVMETVPFLLAELEDPALSRRAVAKLKYLLCRDHETEPWRYRSLYEAAPQATHADHFLDALRERGVLVPPGLTLEDPEANEFLLQGVADTRWYVRRTAVDFLEERTGQTLGALSVQASAEEMQALAKRWREYLEQQ